VRWQIHATSIIAYALVFACAIAMLAWWQWPKTPPSASIPLSPAMEVRNEDKTTLTNAAPAKVYSAKVKAKFTLPDAVQSDPAQHVSAVGKLDTMDRPYTVTAVYDEDTGESSVYARADTLPWVSATQRGQVGLHYGIKNGLRPVTRISVSQSFLSIKALQLGGAGTLDSDGQWFVGVGINYRW